MASAVACASYVNVVTTWSVVCVACQAQPLERLGAGFALVLVVIFNSYKNYY